MNDRCPRPYAVDHPYLHELEGYAQNARPGARDGFES
jgi:hypothetical protein